MLYEVYRHNKLFYTFLNEEAARDCCVDGASEEVESLKKNYYYPMLRKRYGVERIKDIPAEIRYKFWADEKTKCLKENYYIKVIDTTPSEEELNAFHERALKYRQQKKKKR